MDRMERSPQTRRRLRCLLGLAAVTLALAARPGLAQGPRDHPEAEAALFKRAEAFVEAFGKGDAKALAAFWTPDGDYTDETGKHLKGREAIEMAFAEMFSENPGVKLRIDMASLRFITPDVAVEDGVTSVIPPDGGPPSRARYTVVHVKKDGQWYLDSVRDAAYAPPTNYDKLRGLDWIIGDWADAESDGEVGRVSFEWTDNQNFITGTFATTFKNISLHAGREWIGWDPLNNKIRSWMFDSDGGFGEGSWTLDGDKLTIRTQSVTRDGKKLAATNIVTRLDPNTVTWQSKERRLDGKPLPDIGEIKMKRQPQ
jgi:uncharacterized protein (TIGR02246 family)